MTAEFEEQELAALEAEQAQLEEQVAQFELERETAKSDVARFQKRYNELVGRLYVELDELNAALARQLLDGNPDDVVLIGQAASADAQARKSAEDAGLIEAQPSPPAEISPECKKTYRKAAMLMHPDRATSEIERARRTQMMAKVNLAYESGDQAALEKLIVEFGEDPEAVSGEEESARLEKARRRIAQLRRRLDEIGTEMDILKISEIFRLKASVEEASAKGVNLLAEMARRLVMEITLLRRKLKPE